MQELATRDRVEWASTQGALRARGWGLLGAGALLVALGTLATWARYRPVAA